MCGIFRCIWNQAWWALNARVLASARPFLFDDHTTKIRQPAASRFNWRRNVCASYAPDSIWGISSQLALSALRDSRRLIVPICNACVHRHLAPLARPGERAFDFTVGSVLPGFAALTAVQLVATNALQCRYLRLVELTARAAVMTRAADALVDIDIAVPSEQGAALFADSA